MNLHRVGVLLKKELHQSTHSMLFIFATVIPILVSLIVSLVFGRLFEPAPRVGILDQGESQMIALFQERTYLDTRIYTDADQLRSDTENGVVEMGLIVPAGFDDAVRDSQEIDLTILFWGEAPITDQGMLVTSLASNVVEIGERDIPVTVEPVYLGSGEITSWSERLLPLLVLMSLIMGGTLIPASSLVDEKQRRTLRALTITPTTLIDVMASKLLLGMIISLVMGLVLLVMNQAFGTEPFLLIMVLALGTFTAATFGILLGALTKDMNTLFAIIKALALILYAPAIIEIIPNLPEWLARIFPTYYLISPIQRIALDGVGLSEIAGDVSILSVISIVLIGCVLLVVQRQDRLRPAAQ